jgi:hypothetical protein
MWGRVVIAVLIIVMVVIWLAAIWYLFFFSGPTLSKGIRWPL